MNRIKASDLRTDARGIARKIMKVVRERRLALKRGCWGVDVTESPDLRFCTAPDGEVCAVGAGVLWDSSAIHRHEHPMQAFSRQHGVSILFVRGVNDGFEGCDLERAWSGPWKERALQISTFVEAELASAQRSEGPERSAPLGSRADYRTGRRLGRYIVQRSGCG